MPRLSKAEAAKVTVAALKERLAASANPDTKPAVEAIEKAALRLFSATEGADAATLLRVLADDLDAMGPAKRAAHRPKGATQYRGNVRFALQWAEQHEVPKGNKYGRDRLLARTLHHLQGEKPGKFGQDENAIYQQIIRIRHEGKRARRDAAKALGADKAEAMGSLAEFLYRDWEDCDP